MLTKEVFMTKPYEQYQLWIDTHIVREQFQITPKKTLQIIHDRDISWMPKYKNIDKSEDEIFTYEYQETEFMTIYSPSFTRYKKGIHVSINSFDYEYFNQRSKDALSSLKCEWIQYQNEHNRSSFQELQNEIKSIEYSLSNLPKNTIFIRRLKILQAYKDLFEDFFRENGIPYIEWNKKLWELGLDYREQCQKKRSSGQFLTYREAYRAACKVFLYKGKEITWKTIENNVDSYHTSIGKI